jgi:ribose 5-phosphate isomerase A
MEQLIAQNLKEIAARYAVNHYIQSGMNIGLGTGSTAAYAVVALAERIRAENLHVGVVISTSAETAQLAEFHGIPVTRDLAVTSGWLDVTIDGADEVDPNLNLIKGGGGALLREKLVAAQTHREVIIVDESKISRRLGEKHSLAVMVIPYAWDTTAIRLSDLGAGYVVSRRRTPTDEVFVSDDGLYCLDIDTGPIDDPAALESRIKQLTGVVDVGLFVGLTKSLIVARAEGRVEVVESPNKLTVG